MKLFETEDTDSRGQVGIGTLIVFIAMVLVAAIGASVLINTAGILQSQSQQTGDQARAQVSNHIDVVDKVGEVDANGNNVTEVQLTVKKAAGAQDINLNETTLVWTSDDNHEKVIISDAIQNGNVALNSTGDSEAHLLTERSQSTTLELNANYFENGAFEEGEEGTVTLIDQSGAESTTGMSVPTVLDDKNWTEL